MKSNLLCRTCGMACVAMVVGYFVVGLWPFSFHPVNNVSHLPGRGGLHFEPPGIAYDTAALPADFPGGLADQPASFSFEFWLEPELEPNTDVFYILAIDDEQPQSNLVVCQWKKEFLIRARDSGSRRGFKEVGIGDALQKQQARVITVTGDATGTAFYNDGKLMERFPDFVLPARNLRGRMVLGNCSIGRAAWTGQLFGMAIFNRVLDSTEVARHQAIWTQCFGSQLTNEPGLTALHLFDQENSRWAEDRSANRHRVFIPPRYEVLHKLVLATFSEDSPDDGSPARDIVINLAGFVPFGFCAWLFLHTMASHRSLRNVLLAVSAGALVSLSIELIQVWLPGRHSSMTDLACNIGGTILGALIAVMIRSRTTAPASDPETPSPAPSS